MQWLKELILEPKILDWIPTDIICMARDNPHLTKLEILSYLSNDKMKFGQEYKEMFEHLNKERKNLSIRVCFYEGREIKISASGFTELYDAIPDDLPYQIVWSI